MSTEPTSGEAPAGQAGLFADLVIQHANMALVFCGALPHPETGQPVRDLETARMLIDRLDMLQAKTRGNLDAEETALLRQSLAAARMAFVEATRHPGPAAAAPAAPAPAAPAEAPAPPAAGPDSAAAEESRRKFVKKD